MFGAVYDSFDENPTSPKRNLRSLAIIAEIIRRLDVVAIQEVSRDTEGIPTLVSEFLGANWDLILSDVTAGTSGNQERLAFVIDRRPVTPTGLAGEVVLPKKGDARLPEQFDRTPYLVGFQAGEERFTLLTDHIRYGDVPQDRLAQLKALATFTAAEIRDRPIPPDAEENNLIVLGNFNIDKRGADPLFQEFVPQGLNVPLELFGLKTTFRHDAKFYDQTAWFIGDDFDLSYTDRAGTVDFAGAVYQELDTRSTSFRVSDHFPPWAEFRIDRSAERFGQVLGLSEVELAAPNPLDVVPD